MTDRGELVLVEREEDIGVLTLNDPDRKNALSIAMKEQLLAGLDSLDDVRCLVLEGAGDAFCAGGDIDQMEQRMESTEETPLEAMRKSLTLTNDIVAKVASYPAPVVVKVNGAAVGGGASLSLAGDIRVASEYTKIGFVFRQVGLGLDGGASYHLPRIVGTEKAKELALTGRIVNAAEALDIGLVHHVFDAKEYDEKCDEIAENLARGPTEAFRQIKKLLNRSPNKTLEQALEDEVNAQTTLVESRDHQEGVRAFLDNRDPDFVGR
jgi:enoyl-CoA hydratase/carnithine racemase